MGSTGTGKSVTIRKAIEILKKELGEDSFKVVELCSYMYDDNTMVLKAISRQLGNCHLLLF